MVPSLKSRLSVPDFVKLQNKVMNHGVQNRGGSTVNVLAHNLMKYSGATSILG